MTFAGTLRRVMKTRHMTSEAVALTAGVDRSTVSTWFARSNIPSPAVAAKLAKALDAPQLIEAAHAERLRTCAFCGVEYEAFNRRTVARFCQPSCRVRWWATERRRLSTERRIDGLIMARNQVEDLLADKRGLVSAIDRHCRACEPEGACHDGSCELREYSPFILVERRFA